MNGRPRRTSGTRHWTGFVAAGLIALAVDAAVLWLLTRGLDMSPFLARLFAISIAMVAGFLAHRRLTFDVPGPPTVAEFGRFAAVAWTSSAVNYGVFVAILVLHPALQPMLALIGATAVSMIATYVGLRFSVFRNR